MKQCFLNVENLSKKVKLCTGKTKWHLSQFYDDIATIETRSQGKCTHSAWECDQKVVLSTTKGEWRETIMYISMFLCLTYSIN